MNGQQLGYLNSDLAAEVVSKSGRGYRFAVFIKGVTGEDWRGQSLGVNLLIIQAEPGVPDRGVKKYLRRLFREDPELEGLRLKGGCWGRLIAIAAVIVLAWIVYTYLSGRR
jgi:hypothetical protein